MVESIGTKAITTDAATRVAAAAPVAAVANTAGPATTPTAAAPLPPAALAQAMAASPPVDTDRVATIKKAIADGRFPIVPATIADRLIALKLQWKPNEPA